jgi:hypothetical protein
MHAASSGSNVAVRHSLDPVCGGAPIHPDWQAAVRRDPCLKLVRAVHDAYVMAWLCPWLAFSRSSVLRVNSSVRSRRTCLNFRSMRLLGLD